MSPRERVNSVTWVPLSYFEDSFFWLIVKKTLTIVFKGTVLSEFPESFLSIIRCSTHIYTVLLTKKHSSWYCCRDKVRFFDFTFDMPVIKYLPYGMKKLERGEIKQRKHNNT